MLTRNIYLSFTFFTLLWVLNFPASGWYIDRINLQSQNNSEINSAVKLEFFDLSTSKKPTNLWCLCDDESYYSYGNSCMVGWVGCEANPCPPSPPGCSND